METTSIRTPFPEDWVGGIEIQALSQLGGSELMPWWRMWRVGRRAGSGKVVEWVNEWVNE